MTITIPETEPYKIQAGETLKWKRTDLTDYPAPTWTLSYTLIHPSNTKITITASQDGSSSNHSVSETPATTAAYTAGVYKWIAEATDGTDVYKVDSGTVEILTDIAAATTYDFRSTAQKTYEAYKSLIEGKATASTLDEQGYSIAGRSVSKATPAEIRTEYLRWKRLYQNELDAERINNGQGTRRKILTRFIA